MAKRGLLAGLDAGTTSVRTVLFTPAGQEVAARAESQRTISRRPGWVEQDPEEIFRRLRRTLAGALASPPARGHPLLAIGVTNQRESVVALDASTGRAIGPAVIWQDTRTAGLARELSAHGWGDRCWDRGGLPLSTYPSAPKMRWLLENDRKVASAAAQGTLRFGTLDTWLIYRLLGGRPHQAPWITDASNASRTLLYDLETGAWSPSLLHHFAIEPEQLARVAPSFGEVYGRVPRGLGLPAGVPVAADLGDQQSSLLGLGRGRSGTAKLTLGTGAFFLAEGAPAGTGRRQGLIRTVLWEGPAHRRELGLEGGVGTAGAFLDWLAGRGLGLFPSLQAISSAASRSRPGADGVVFLPAFAGLFAPHWDPTARGSLTGLSLSTGREEIARAALEGIAHRVADILEAHVQARGKVPPVVWVDGGLSRSRFLLQSIADLSGATLRPAAQIEATSLGAALAAGIGVEAFPGGRVPVDAGAGSRRHDIRPRRTLAKDRRGAREVWRRRLRLLMDPPP